MQTNPHINKYWGIREERNCDSGGTLTSPMVWDLTILQAEPFLLPTDAHNVKKHRVIKTF